jgi:hypothetical protein
MESIGKIQRVPLREVWEHEALDFTSWLRDNIDVLNEVLEHEELNLYLSDINIEQPAGDFSVDMVAKDNFGNMVVIENQLEKSDHDHLGKLITYLAAQGAKNAIWIVSFRRPEHVAAISWLNDSTKAAIHMFKVEAIKIGESLPAPLFTLILGKPNDDREKLGGPSPRDLLVYEFWKGLLERANGKTHLHSNIAPPYQSWIGTGAGKTGLSFSYVIFMHAARVELYIDSGSKEINKKIFYAIKEAETEIEAEFGEKLEWQPLEDQTTAAHPRSRAAGYARRRRIKMVLIRSQPFLSRTRMHFIPAAELRGITDK